MPKKSLTRRPLAKVVGDLIDAYEAFIEITDAQGATYAKPQADCLEALLSEIKRDHKSAAQFSFYLGKRSPQ